MGNKQAKKKPDEVKVQAVEVDSSSGFHILEVHAPTAGASIIGIIFVVCLFVTLYFCLRRLRICPRFLARQETGKIPRDDLERSLNERLDRLERMGNKMVEREHRRRLKMRDLDEIARELQQRAWGEASARFTELSEGEQGKHSKQVARMTSRAITPARQAARATQPAKQTAEEETQTEGEALLERERSLDARRRLIRARAQKRRALAHKTFIPYGTSDSEWDTDAPSKEEKRARRAARVAAARSGHGAECAGRETIRLL